MKKTIFNRILIITIIAVILLNWIFNYIAFADSTTEQLEDIEIQESSVGAQTYMDLKRKVVEELQKQLEEKYNYQGTVEELAEVCGIDLEDGTAGIESTSEGKIIKIDDDTTIVLSFSMMITTGANSSGSSAIQPYTNIVIKDISVVKNTGEDNNDEKNENDANSNSIISGNEIIINGKDYQGNTNWDIGGVLLKPLFFLVNCVFDTLLAVLQKIMYSDVTDLNLLSYYVKTNYMDKLRVVDSRNIDPMFQLSTNQINYFLFTNQKISNVEYPHIHYSPEEIFSGQISLLNIDFISGEGQAEGLGVVRQTIATWYNALRLIATVGFLSVLIYIGIKIMLSANSKDKAKYKEWIIDWIIGLAILYSMHYLMAFIITAINQLNDKLITVMPILRVAAGNGYESFSTNLIGLVRFCTQYDTVAVKIGYEIMYIMLVIYTFKFTFIYLKRVLYMAFLTLIAPIVAFTYPIDKSLDGKAEGFTMWLKEYFFNALLQPMHYLLYYVMVSSSMEIAVDNPLYAIAVLAFMLEAERLVRKIFGFDKAHEGTVGGLGTAFSGLALAHGVQKLSSLGKGANSSSKTSMPYPGATNKDYDDQEFLSAGENINNYSDNSSNINNSNYSNNTQNQTQTNSTDNSYINFNPSGRPKLAQRLEPRKVKKQHMPIPIRNLANKAMNSSIGQKASSIANTKAGRGIIGGTKALGKRVARPIWDFDRSGKYNGKRLARNIVKGALGVGVGITAAAVQAGISLTDGKYSPVEGIATFGAGVALMGRKVDNVVDTFEEGYTDNFTKEEKMEEYKEQFRNRDDVIQFCKENSGEDDWKEYRERIIDNYVTRGFIDLKEIKQCTKYANKVAKEVNDSKTYLNTTQKKKTLKVEKDKQDIIAMYILSQKNKRKKIQASAASYNKKKEERYIHSITQGMEPKDAEKVGRQERNISASIRMFDRITQS